eukprot:4546058-Pyramimonas_sp.AAC.1
MTHRALGLCYRVPIRAKGHKTSAGFESGEKNKLQTREHRKRPLRDSESQPADEEDCRDTKRAKAA